MESGNLGAANCIFWEFYCWECIFFFPRSCKFLGDWNNESTRRRSSDFKGRV
ncbi:hypothetical protein LINPERPRIM_LOCUS11914 [Linum perenne]